MNALRAPLTALYVSAEMEIVFSLDIADAFIDGRLIITYPRVDVCPEQTSTDCGNAQEGRQTRV